MLASLSDIKTAIGITGTNEDGSLTYLLNAADAEIKNYVHQDVERVTGRVEYYTGTATQVLVLRQRPVIAVSEVRCDFQGYFGDTANSFNDTTLLVPGVDYTLDRNYNGTVSKSGILFRIANYWPQVERYGVQGQLSVESGVSFGNIRVTYDSGYAAAGTLNDPAVLPPAIAMAVVQLVSYWRMTLKNGGGFMTYEKLGRWEYEIQAPHLGATSFGGIPDTVRRSLDSFVDPVM